MNKIVGKVVVKETGVGAKDLLIVVYDLDPKMHPEEVSKMCGSDRNFDIWEKILGNRLGSILTDENGKFELEYEDSEFQIQDKERRPDIVLFVVAPEDPTIKPCPKILHVSCGTRWNAGRIENYVIKLPLSLLTKSGVTIPGTTSLSLYNSGMEDVLSKMETLAKEKQQKHTTDKRFSEYYKEKKERIAKALEKTKQPDPPMSFDFTIPISFPKNFPHEQNAKIIYDKGRKSWMLKTPKTADREERSERITFKGVTYTNGPKEDNAPRGICYHIDPDKKEFSVCLPRSPVKLVAPEPKPSKLYTWYSKRLRTMESAESTSADDSSVKDVAGISE